MTKKIVAIGELLWDILPQEDKLGGAPANLAYRMNSLGCKTFLVSRVGDDSRGVEAMGLLKEHELDISNIQVDKIHPTGTVDVFFDAQKNPEYTINYPAAYDFMEWNAQLDMLAASADCIVYGTLIQRSEKTAESLYQMINAAENAIKFCDVNLRKDCYTSLSISRSLEKADIAKLNHNEAYEIGKMFGFEKKELIEIMAGLRDMFQLEICFVTMEAKGALAIDSDERIMYTPGYLVEMGDPLGAGDAFSAAFLSEHLRSGNLCQSLENGNFYGAIVVTQQGAMQPVNEGVLENFMSVSRERVVEEKYVKFWDKKVMPDLVKHLKL